MEDYYGYHPVRVLQRPLAIVGYLGAPLEQLGNVMANLSGLPLFDVNRAIEHQAGRSVAQLVLEQGESAYRALEKQEVARGLRSLPFGLLVVGEGSLSDLPTLGAVEQQAALVYVHHEVGDLAHRIRERRRYSPGCYFPWVPLEGPCEGDLAVGLSDRMDAYERAVIGVGGTGRSAESIADEILERFDLVHRPPAAGSDDSTH